jgi:hypothetical protein
VTGVEKQTVEWVRDSPSPGFRNKTLLRSSALVNRRCGEVTLAPGLIPGLLIGVGQVDEKALQVALESWA